MSSMDVDKTHEIMARFRPIAPRPPLPAATGDKPAAAALYLQAKPCRVRRRSRGSLASSSMPPPPPQQQQSVIFPVYYRRASQLAFQQVLPVPLLPMQEQNLPLSLLSVPVEKDLLQKLQYPKVIAPQPVRSIRSSISVGPIETLPGPALPPVSKKPEEVEEEMESERLPAIISDSKNRVRLVNAAYKEMVGQPECSWLESMVSPFSKRISGEVKLDLSDAASVLPVCSNGFSCRVKIEWESNGVKSIVSATCNVIRLHCDAQDYFFTWKFRTIEDSATKCCIFN